MLEEGAEEFGFQDAEGWLAVFSEDFRNTATLLLDDHLVGVDEWIPKGLGKVSSNGGLARSHEADENNVPLHVDVQKSSF